MRNRPKRQSTKIGSEPWEWIPQDFDCFLEELKAIEEHCQDIGHWAIFRGQSDRKWLLDSTFVRSCKEIIFGIPSWEKLRKDFRLSSEHQQIVGNLFLLKFGSITFPSGQLLALQKEQGIDAWFEWMRRLQQYPEEDKAHLKGTFLMDWTNKPEVAVYFSNEKRTGEGAVWICDISATGKTLHRKFPVGKMLEKMQEAIKNNESLGIPLIFYPEKQLAFERTKNQDVIYVAQMNLKIDLSEIWNLMEEKNKTGERIFVKLVLPAETNEKCMKWLEDKGITRKFLFPDEVKR